MATDDDDRIVKELIGQGNLPLDPQTQADLEKWFGMPSATELIEQGKEPGIVDREMLEVQERRDKAIAAVDPALLDAIRLRTDEIQNPIGTPKRTIDVLIDPTIALYDERMVARAMTLSDPREIEISEALIDDLKECTPQALLRDLHRPELEYEKTFEIVDAAAEQRLDIVAEVRAAMRASWRLPAFGATPLQESRAVLADLRSQHRQPWTSFLPLLTNRSVQE